MLQPANLTPNHSAGIELAPYLIHVHRHMFAMKLENVTVRCHTFGGVVSITNAPRVFTDIDKTRVDFYEDVRG